MNKPKGKKNQKKNDYQIEEIRETDEDLELGSSVNKSIK